jgi:hypothetical protein
VTAKGEGDEFPEAVTLLYRRIPNPYRQALAGASVGQVHDLPEQAKNLFSTGENACPTTPAKRAKVQGQAPSLPVGFLTGQVEDPPY